MQIKKICIRCYVSGRVQGVWYRSSAQQEAQKLGVTGWAKNLSDGRVEVMACGELKSVKKFVTWLWKGPMLASVTDVDGEQVAWEDYAEFVTL